MPTSNQRNGGQRRSQSGQQPQSTRVMPVQPGRKAQGGFVPVSGVNTKHNPQSHHTNSVQPSGVPVGMGSSVQYSRNSQNYANRKTKMSVGKKVGIVVLIVAIVAAITGVGAFAYAQMRINQVNADLHSMDQEELKAVDAELTGTTKTIDEPFTVLLLGSDARADDPDMGARTDTIILTRVDPVKNTVSMVSIPRDTMVTIDGVGTTKINAAYSYGGASGAISAVKDLTGIEIDHYAEVNFEGLEGLVDAIGGIDVEVDEEIDDYYAGGHVDAGKQHLDGEHALILARSRQYADGDYTRQVNQRKVILAIVDKVLTSPARDLAGLISASTGFVSTDSGIDFDFILALAQQMRNNDNEFKMSSVTIPSRPAYINDVSYVIADKAGVAELMDIFVKGGDVTQELTQSSIDSDIANAGGTSTSSSGASIYEEYTYYQPPAETQQTYVDYSQQTYVDNTQQQTYVEPAADTGGGAAPADTGGGAAAGTGGGTADTGGGGGAAAGGGAAGGGNGGQAATG